MAVLSLISIPVAAEVVFTEALFVGHIVFLVETLGFAWGLVAFTVIWAALGIVVLAVRDSVWPRIVPLLDRLHARFTSRLADLLGRTGAKVLLAVIGVSGVLVAVGLVVALAGGEVKDWAVDHRGDVAAFLIAAAVVLVILLVIARIGRGILNWVRSVAGAARPATRLFATLVTMAMLGPALSWPLFRLFGYTGRTTYVLTLVSAPVFGLIWVPVYGLGVWGLVEGLL